MKKICLILASLLMISCGSSSSASLSNESSTETEPTETIEPVKAEEPAETVRSSLADELLGEWELIPAGETARNEITGIKLSFDAEGMRVTNDITGSSSFSKVEFGDIYGLNNGQITKMTVTPVEVSGSEVNEKDILSVPVDFAVLLSSVNGGTYLALRELGNGMSYFGISEFKLEYQDKNYFWTFRKKGDEPSSLTKKDLRRGEEFYAFCWFRTDESLYLQEVGTDIRMEEWYGLEQPTIYFVMEEEPNAAVEYPVAEEIQWRIYPQGRTAYAGSVSPCLMRIITDENGNIKKFYDMRYLGYGFYEASEGSMISYADLLPDGPELVYAFYPGGINTHEDDMVYVDVSTGAPVLTAILATKTQLLNFRVLNLTLEEFDEANEPIFSAKELYRQDRFYPEHPIALSVTIAGDIPNIGISYEEPYGDRKYYALSQSGMDGSLFLEELNHVKE